MSSVKFYDGSAWRPMLDYSSEKYNWRAASEWYECSPFRPHGTDWQSTRTAVDRHEQRDLGAPRHMWVGDRWWPPEATVTRGKVYIQSNGSWIIGIAVTYGDHAHESRPPVSPIPPITYVYPWKDGTQHQGVLSPNKYITMSRSWNGSGWEVHLNFTLTWVHYLAANLDPVKPMVFGLDGDAPWGPSQAFVFMPQPHGHPAVHAPSRPTGLRVTSTAPYAVGLSWTPVAGVMWELTRDGHVIATVDKPNYVDHVPHANTDYHYQLRAVNSGGKSPVATVTGHSKPVPAVVKPPVAHTVHPSINWHGTYGGSGSSAHQTGTSVWGTKLVQGGTSTDGGAIHGNAHGLVKFDLSHIPTGAHITSAKLTLTALHWWNNSGGTAHIHLLHMGAGHALAHHIPVGGRQRDLTWNHKTGTRTIDLGAAGWNLQNFKPRSDSTNTVQIGKAHGSGLGDQAEYGVFESTGAHKPVLTIRYTI